MVLCAGAPRTDAAVPGRAVTRAMGRLDEAGEVGIAAIHREVEGSAERAVPLVRDVHPWLQSARIVVADPHTPIHQSAPPTPPTNPPRIPSSPPPLPPHPLTHITLST